MQAPPFWPAPYPFKDILVFSQRNQSLAPHMEAIRRSASELELGLARIGDHGDLATHVLTSGTLSNHPTTTTLLSGVAQSQGTFYFGQDSLSDSIDVGGLGDSVGIFTYLRGEPHEITFGQDFFGCGIVFYFAGPDYFVASNRYHLLLLFLSWAGHRGRLNPSKVVANLFSNGTFFHQNITHDMDIVGVKQVPLDQEVVINGFGWRISSKKAVQEALNGSSDVSREELLQRAKAEILDNVRSAAESGRFDKIVTDLSGGMDSRAVFAAILNIESARTQTELRSNDVPGSRDLELATGLKNLFGLRFYTDSGRPQLPLSATEALDLWRSYFMGTYHRVGSAAWSAQGRNLGELRLSGGCGEVHRTFWTKIYRAALADATTAQEVAARIVGVSASKTARAVGAALRVVDLLRDELDELPGDDAVEQLENHYLFFRNRYHFGMRAVETFYDSPMWFPLMSKSLFLAARSQGPLDRGNGLILELTERLHPLLVWIDYDSVAASENPLLSSITLSDPRFRGCRVSLDSDTAEWHSIQQANRTLLQQARHPMDDDFNRGWREYDQRVRTDALQAAQELESLSDEADRPVIQALLAEVTEYLDNPRLTAQFYSKLSSLRDQAAIFE